MRNYHIGYRGENSIYTSKISEHAEGGFSNLQIHRYEFIRSILAQFSANFLLECWEAFIVRTITYPPSFLWRSKQVYALQQLHKVCVVKAIHTFFFKAINVEVFAEKVV